MRKRRKMKIRNYKKEDIPDIEKLGLLLHNNYKFLLDDFSNALVIIEEEKVIGFIVYSTNPDSSMPSIKKRWQKANTSSGGMISSRQPDWPNQRLRIE